jgi:hypothetical protein
VNHKYHCRKCTFETDDLNALRSHGWTHRRNGSPVPNAPAIKPMGDGMFETAEHELKQRAHRAVDEMDTASLNKAIAQLQALRDHGEAIGRLLTGTTRKTA